MYLTDLRPVDGACQSDFEEDPMCRKCRNQYETLDHVLKCGRDEEISSNIYCDAEYLSKDLITTQLSRTALRIQQFYDDVKEINE